MKTKEKRSEKRRSQILDAATTVFTRQGFEKARMDDIVDEANLSKGTLYWYFKSKNDIIYAILERIFNAEFNSVLEQIGPDSSAVDQLNQFISLMLADLKKMEPIMPLMYDFFALGFRQRIVRNFMGTYLRKFVHMLEPIIEKGVQEGAFRAVNAREAALAIGAVLEGTILLRAYDPDNVVLDSQIRAGMDLLIQGMLKQ